MTDGWELLEQRRARVLAGKPAVEPDSSPSFRRIERADDAQIVEPPRRSENEQRRERKRKKRRNPGFVPSDPRTAVVTAVQRGVRSGDPGAIVSNVAQLILNELARRIR